MEHDIKQLPGKGNVLWLTDGKTEVGLALDYGIRIIHLSCAGRENLLYEQPADLSDGLTTEKGWRIYGGHRLWTAPESDLSYYPDRAPVSYELTEHGALLTQSVDPWLMVKKQLLIEFQEDGSLFLRHRVENVSDAEKTYASWGVTTFAGKCSTEIPFAPGSDIYTPQRKIALWGSTALSDSRLKFTSDRILAKHDPGRESLKIGIFSKAGHAELINKGQRFLLDFEADSTVSYADDGCNFELYIDENVLELEAVGRLGPIAPGKFAEHWERWRTELIQGG